VQSQASLYQVEQVAKMPESPPIQAQILSSMSVFLTAKLNEAIQNQDWVKVAAISRIINAAVQCLKEVEPQPLVD
jgi:hypothetical protein